ncbi:MAG: type II CRISPR RNA-guided endonuclease Cas9 [Pyrinomonadaceae bacterium]
MSKSILVLGLDLGVTSAGWALIRTIKENGEIVRHEIVKTGVRIFPATVEAKTAAPKNLERRTSRGARRLLRRKRQRRQQIKTILAANGLLPQLDGNSESKFDSLGNPYELRASGIGTKLEPFEIGRAIFHIAKRRGFLSNRKSGKSSEDGVVFGGIAKVSEEMERGEFKTLGSLLNSKDKKRKHYSARKMVEDEFDLFWETQSKFHPDMLTDYLKTDLKNVIFYQRPISSNRGLIGRCTFEKDKKRCDMARQDAQRMRYWQDINNLKLQDRTTLKWRELRPPEKELLAKALENLKKKEFPIEEVRRTLGIGEDVRINLDDKNIKGNTTSFRFWKAIGSRWHKLSPEQQESLTEDFIRIETETALEKRLREYWKFNDVQVVKLIKLELESGYSRCSLKAIRKILPLMKEGKRYDEATTEIYGDHRGQSKAHSFARLEAPPADLRNPIVAKALNEMRKVVNAIVREYGLPDEIRLEMARDLKLTKKQKLRVQNQIKKNEAANKLAEQFYQQKFGMENVSGTDKLRYRLWKEAGEKCPYTGIPIPPETLLGDQWDIEHIIPYSRSFDDSYMNKTLCEAKFNRETKLNKTPFEIFGDDEQARFEMGQRITSMPFGKRRKFELQEIDEDKMVARMLSDTRYICREARGYLRQLYPYSPDEGKYVQVVAGGSTAKLRYNWHVNAILADGDIDVKNRWDHRHHAIDAIVIALTDRALFQRISKLAAQNEERLRKSLKGLPLPWDDFLNDVGESVNSIVVSHAPTRRIRGQLFEETAYGPTTTEGLYVVRKPLASITAAMIKKGEIVDQTVRVLIENRVEQCGGDLKKAFAEPLYHKDGRTPIRNVRLHVTKSPETIVGIKNKSGEVYKYYPLAGNHHVKIYENTQTEERTAVLVPRYYAAQRNWKPADLGETWRLLFSLCANDYIEFLGDDGQLRIYRVQKMSGGLRTNLNVRPLEDARSDYISGVSIELKSSTGFKKIIRKLQVDPLGRLTQAND